MYVRGWPPEWGDIHAAAKSIARSQGELDCKCVWHSMKQVMVAEAMSVSVSVFVNVVQGMFNLWHQLGEYFANLGDRGR